jgi:CRISPR-associated protein Cas2
MIHILISYDVATTTREGRRRLRHVARACQDFGVRVQFSVFECTLSPANWTRLRARLLATLSSSEDSLRIYRLCSEDVRKIEHHGVREPRDLEGALIL